MKKTQLSALAVAMGVSLVAAPVSAVELSYSGIVQAHLYFSDDSLDDDGMENGERIAAGDVRFQVEATKEMNGNEGYGRIRLDADGLSQDDVDADNVTVGYRGAFGDIMLGEVPKVASFGELANDMHGFNSDSEQHIGYQGSMGGLTYALTYSPENNQDQTGVGLKYVTGGLTLGVGYDSGKIGDEDGLADEAGVIVGAKYALDGGHSIAIHSGQRDTFEVTAIEGKTSLAGWGVALTYSMLDGVSDIARLNLSRPLNDNLSWDFRYQDTSPEEGDGNSFFRTSMTFTF